MALHSGMMVGGYQLERELSTRGGCAQIFLAFHPTNPEFKMVLKISKDGKDMPANRSAYRDLLRLEAETLSKLRHPGIARIFPIVLRHNSIKYAGRATTIAHKPWYFALEYIDGPLLDISKLRDFPLKWRVELFYQLLIIVDYMHSQKIAHGDLKPDNIFLRHQPHPEQMPLPVLIDFGTASSLERVGPELGVSIQYAAPELLAALTRADYPRENLAPEQIDVWALGAILFELVSGQRMVPYHSIKKITTSVLTGQTDKLRDVKPDAPVGLDKLLHYMFETRPPVKQIITAIEERIDEIRPPRLTAVLS